MTDLPRYTPRIRDKQLSEYLEIWAEWMRNYDNRQGYSSRDSVMQSTGSKEFDAMVSEMETKQAETVNAAIDDLPMNERASVYHVKLHSVYRFRESVEVLYARARDMLAVSLARRDLPVGDA